jgi:hypothetical protein
VIKFVSDNSESVVCSECPGFRTINKTDRHHVAEILLKVVLNKYDTTPDHEKTVCIILQYSQCFIEQKKSFQKFK